MDRESPPASTRETEIRWSEARAFLLRRMRHLSGKQDGETDDLVQEALLRLLRALRSAEVRNLDALMTEIARRTWIDFLRRRRVQRAYFESMADDEIEYPNAATLVPGELGDPVRRVRFVVLQFFRERHPKCHCLAQDFFSERDWSTVAEAWGMAAPAIRQQWTRCLQVLRREVAQDSDLLRAWAQFTG